MSKRKLLPRLNISKNRNQCIKATYLGMTYGTRRDARGARKEKINVLFVSHNIDRAAEIIQKSLGFLYRQEK